MEAAALSGASLAATSTAAPDFDDSDTASGGSLIWLIGFVPSLLGIGVATDDDDVMFGMIRLGNSARVVASV